MISPDDYVDMSSEDSSSPYSYDAGGGGDLELGLGLSIGGGGKGSRMMRRRDGDGEIGGNSTKNEAQFLYARILTAKDFPSSCVFRTAATSSSSAAACSSSSTTSSSSSTLSRVGGGTKRSADSAAGGAASAGQVVGWPPVRAYRMNSMVNQVRSVAAEDYNSMAKKNQSKERAVDKVENRSNTNGMNLKARSSLFVKVNMDGIPIGRKVDLSALGTYEALAHTLEDMFLKQSLVNGSSTTERSNTGRRLRLLDGSSEFVITYEDKEGDWMLVGDVPWGMFINSVKRLKIMRTTDATGLGNKDEIR
ncbi:Auxin-responsive protein IAA11 [Linum perenne]